MPLFEDLAPAAAVDAPGMEVEIDEVVERPNEEERVLGWRFDELQRAGFDSELAFTVATQRQIDLHVALGLVARGCPPGTAARILL